ncbi:MAG: pyrroline-5-carboxylate reductase [Firmicutes bacterium]|nr:pyrroline-5-carboxylate reductase [Bacillota bacterium]
MINNKLTERSLLFLGGGRMAAGIIRGLLEKHLMPAERIAVIGRDRTHLAALQKQVEVQEQAALQKQSAVRVFTAGDSGIPRCDAVILAVPPQAASEALAENRKHIPEDALLISVCAGITIAALTQTLGDPQVADASGSLAAPAAPPRIIRVMPNTLGPSGHGFSAICPAPDASEEDIAFAETLFGCLGKVCRIREEQFDAFTAFSCTGPAYVLEFTRAMIQAGMQAGFTESDARAFAVENLLGTGGILLNEGEDPAAMLDRMCTPGGITLTSMETLASQPFAESIGRAVQAGIRRAGEMESDVSSDPFFLQ